MEHKATGFVYKIAPVGKVKNKIYSIQKNGMQQNSVYNPQVKKNFAVSYQQRPPFSAISFNIRQ